MVHILWDFRNEKPPHSCPAREMAWLDGVSHSSSRRGSLPWGTRRENVCLEEMSRQTGLQTPANQICD